jgi:hypothetical protein
MSGSGSGGQAYPVPPVDESGIYQVEWTGGPAAKQPAGGGVGGSSGGAGASGPGFEVESDAVRAQAAILAQCGEQIAQVFSTLRAALSSGGEPWGTDDMGQRFGTSYTGPANQGFASAAGLGAALTNVANELVAQANAYDDVEQALTERFRGIAGQLGGAGTGAAAAGTGGSADSGSSGPPNSSAAPA